MKQILQIQLQTLITHLRENPKKDETVSKNKTESSSTPKTTSTPPPRNRTESPHEETEGDSVEQITTTETTDSLFFKSDKATAEEEEYIISDSIKKPLLLGRFKLTTIGFDSICNYGDPDSLSVTESNVGGAK